MSNPAARAAIPSPACGLTREHMENRELLDSEVRREVRSHDLVAIIAMIDYLIVEIGRIDAQSAHTLSSARKSLLEAIAHDTVQAN